MSRGPARPSIDIGEGAGSSTVVIECNPILGRRITQMDDGGVCGWLPPMVRTLAEIIPLGKSGSAPPGHVLGGPLAAAVAPACVIEAATPGFSLCDATENCCSAEILACIP